MKLSQRLRYARSLKRVTLQEASENAGCSLPFLALLEKGTTTKPKIELLNKLADYYGLSRDTLILEAERLPEDVYWKIIKNPSLLNIIREFDITDRGGYEY